MPYATILHLLTERCNFISIRNVHLNAVCWTDTVISDPFWKCGADLSDV